MLACIYKDRRFHSSVEFRLNRQHEVVSFVQFFTSRLKMVYCYILMIGLAVMRTVKMAWSVDTGHPSLFCYVNGSAEQQFDYFHFTQTLFAHQRIGISLWIRTFTLFCLHLGTFDSQLHFTPTYRLRHFFPYSPISDASLLHQQSANIYLQWLVRRYAPI